MLTRLTDYIERGVIDNRRNDLVMVELYYKGEERPLVLHLEGNCLRDVAGSRLEFKIKPECRVNLFDDSPVRLDIFDGLAGDITASRKVKLSSAGGALSNSLYFEAFVRELGLIVIESSSYEITVSDFEWQMDACAEQAQIMCNQQILRDYVHAWVKRFANNHEEDEPLPDHHWDVRLREAEGLAIAYQEIHYKYRHDICADVSEAFVMGWDDMLGELAESDENGTSFSCRISGTLSLFDILTEDEAIEAQLCMSHPIFQQIINITEETQSLFSKEINDLQIRKVMPREELGVLFKVIRYVTPNMLSCLLQINEGNSRNDVLAERLNRCGHQIDEVLATIPLLQGDEIEDYHSLFVDLKHDILEMRSDLLKQGKL